MCFLVFLFVSISMPILQEGNSGAPLCKHHNVPHDGDSYLTSHFQICLQAVFVPQPESVDDTSYFLSRFSQISSGLLDDQNGNYTDADTCDSSSNSRTEVNYQLTS